jgi:methionine-rich copper-binding protein CopC
MLLTGSGSASPLALTLLNEAEPNDTLDQSQQLGTLSGPVQVAGRIGNGLGGGADVDWYSFTLTRAATVTLGTSRVGAQGWTALSLYNDDSNDFGDPLDPQQHRLLAQDAGSATGGTTQLQEVLGAGTYYVAVSGGGNRYFNPFLADSGYPGAMGDYNLLVSSQDLVSSPQDGPSVLRAEPANGATLDQSPLVLRVSFDEGLDPSTLNPGQTFSLTWSPDGSFDPSTNQDVPVSGFNFSTTSNELQLTPAAPLAMGYYKLWLAGNTTTNASVIQDLNGVPLGDTSGALVGADFMSTFQIAGVDGSTAGVSDDTPATARELGNVPDGGLVQAPGTIGDDPAYNPANADPALQNPANQVELYHFEITSPGQHALTAEVFAGRIGSSLDAGLSLFRRDQPGGPLVFVASNDNSLNDAVANDGTLPLYTDPVLFAGLPAGDYYLAVSSSGNVPNPSAGLLPGTNGIFDPNMSHSGSNGFSIGDYVLNLQVETAPAPPHVISVTPADGTVLSAPPTGFVVQFDEPVNLTQLMYQTQQTSGQSNLPAVTITGSDGVTYYPRLLGYDQATNTAQFMMLDALPNGPAVLHLSSAAGLADLAGDPLVGNDPNGDYVVHYTINGPTRGTPGNPQLWLDQEPNNALAAAQQLGVLFPRDLNLGVTLVRNLTNQQTTVSDTADYYQFQVLQNREYIFTLSGSGLPQGTRPKLFNATGTPIYALPQGTNSVRVTLPPGIYEVSVGGWSSAKAAQVKYQLRISLTLSPDNPTPLTTGPAPAIRLRLASDTSTPAFVGPAAPSSLTLIGPLAPTLPGTPPGGGPTGPSPAGPTSTGGFTTAPVVSVTPVFPDSTIGILLTRVTDSLGGVRGIDSTESTPGSAPVLLVKQDLTSQAFVGLLTLTAAPGGGGAAGSGDSMADHSLPELAETLSKYGKKLLNSWEQAVEQFFRLGESSEQSPSGLSPSGLAPQGEEGEDNGETDTVPIGMSAVGEGADESGVSENGCLGAVAALVGTIAFRSMREGYDERVHDHRKRRRSSFGPRWR